MKREEEEESEQGAERAEAWQQKERRWPQGNFLRGRAGMLCELAPEREEGDRWERPRRGGARKVMEPAAEWSRVGWLA